MTSLTLNLHDAQQRVYDSPARFKIIAAGRRFGKSRLAVCIALIEALKSTEKDVYIVCPTQSQGKAIYWSMLKDIGKTANQGGVIADTFENTLECRLINGRSIFIKGSDRPDNMRGVGLAYVIIDEYADMKPFVFDQIIRPALADVKGGCMFIGTPKGRNHFYDLYYDTYEKKKGPEWECWHFTSLDNPFLPAEEIENARKSMSSFNFRQEFMASFEAAASDLFKPEWIRYSEYEPEDGQFFIAADLAGFVDLAEAKNAVQKKLDQTAIAIVKVNAKGWWVAEILYGRWNIKETAVRIIKAARQYRVHQIGIEKGALRNAILPYMRELMQRTGYHCQLVETTHGNKKKVDRITWALQGRLEHGRIKFKDGPWMRDFLDQLAQFPDSKTHDDLIDALAYIDQLQYIPFSDHETFLDSFDPLDPDTGY